MATKAGVDPETETLINSVLFGERSQHGGSQRPASAAKSQASKASRYSKTAKPSSRKAKAAAPVHDYHSMF